MRDFDKKKKKKSIKFVIILQQSDILFGIIVKRES